MIQQIQMKTKHKKNCISTFAISWRVTPSFRDGTIARAWLSGQEDLAAGAICGISRDTKGFMPPCARVFGEARSNHHKAGLGAPTAPSPFPALGEGQHSQQLDESQDNFFDSLEISRVNRSSSRGRGGKSNDKKRRLADHTGGAQAEPGELLQSRHHLTNMEACLGRTIGFWLG